MRSSHIIYVDESGSSDFGAGNESYPVFVLAFCLFNVDTYINQIDPSFQRLKFQHFGHDLVILHESDIRKKVGAFKALNDPIFRELFLDDLSRTITKSDFRILPIIRTKENEGHHEPEIYTNSAVEGLNRCVEWLKSNGKVGEELIFVLESRGPKDDRRLLEALESIFWHRREPQVTVKFVPKAFASTGLQIADLVARPIGLSAIRPGQANRSFEMIRDKIVH
jgi:hypothetical protein